jgi:rfaE bifunctional protein nucleotidyltransferase chain/domain
VSQKSLSHSPLTIHYSHNKVFKRSALAKIIPHIRRGKKIVFTNGCFDLLHLGHVRLFQKCKALGDILIVAINSDQSLKKLKGGSRPLVPEKSRAEILAALAFIDYVTIFSEDTPAETIRLLKPDILVKGGDYKLSQIVGRQDVKKVVRMPLVKNYSTTNLIQKIVKAYGKP